ncbi:MAG: peptidoglycan DD-metalloendopeptidase family protein [Clostridia bacterium]|nr:peptidoglycan DD-metalloendopeptidase family protein [Clostridia bacterium]
MKRSKRLISFLLCFAMVLGCCSLFSGAVNYEQQKNELNSLLASQKKELASLQNDLARAKKEVADQLVIIQLLYDEMNSYQNQLNTVVSLISEYTALAKAKEAEIQVLNAQIQKNFEYFKTRLVFAQESGNMSYIDFLLGSSDLSDIISRSEVINDMLEHDRKIIEDLTADKKAVEAAKAEVDAALKESKAKEAEYEAIVATLKEKKAEADALLETLQGNQKKAQAALNIVNAAKKKTEDEIDKINKKLAAMSASKPGPTGFIWPLPATSPGYITQKFHSGHSGLDIGVGGWVNNGKIPAISVAAGDVVRVGTYSDWGNLVVVDHGGGYLSYYAHLDSISVSLGQRVIQGQQVGKIGSTGQSTGPHLHLVIYAPDENGNFVRSDPEKFVIYPG